MAFVEAAQDFFETTNLLLRLHTVQAQPVVDFGVVGEPVELSVDQRQRLLFDGMSVLEAGDEGGTKIAA